MTSTIMPWFAGMNDYRGNEMRSRNKMRQVFDGKRIVRKMLSDAGLIVPAAPNAHRGRQAH